MTQDFLVDRNSYCHISCTFMQCSSYNPVHSLSKLIANVMESCDFSIYLSIYLSRQFSIKMYIFSTFKFHVNFFENFHCPKHNHTMQIKPHFLDYTYIVKSVFLANCCLNLTISKTINLHECIFSG